MSHDDEIKYVVPRPLDAGDQLNKELKEIRDELARIKKETERIYDRIRLGPKPSSWIEGFFYKSQASISIGQAVSLILEKLKMEPSHIDSEWILTSTKKKKNKEKKHESR